MVIVAAGEHDQTMTTVPERSSGLHNFSSLPCFNVKWGRQKQLRCVKESGADHNFPSSSTSSPSQIRRSSPDIGGIEAMREKLMLEIRSEAEALQMKAWKNSGDDGASKPWNLRSRRAVCKEPTTTTTSNNNVAGSSDRKPYCQPVEFKSTKRSIGGDVGRGPRAKFSVSLSKQEIEEDFLTILGSRPARRPTKRPRAVQKQIDRLFPGLWLSEITADMYKVNEHPEAAKK